MRNEKQIIDGFEYAKEIYSSVGVNVEKAIEETSSIPISMNCWQGDDVIGFDSDQLTGGIAATGNYPGRARTPQELRSDIELAMSLIPGTKRLNLHASYAEKQGRNVDRDEYDVSLFKNWIDWSNENNVSLDFNPTFFSHKMMDGNFTLSSTDEKTRAFWIEHGKRCREIAQEFAKNQGNPCSLNFWLPDGYKDVPADTKAPRERMMNSLDEIFALDIDKSLVKDAIESKLFGIGIEANTVVSHEFALLYAQTRNILYTLDAGHFHPTEVISAKFSAVLSFMDEILLHVSRPMRWDSDHVVLFDDELQAIMREVVRGGYSKNVYIGLDFFDASINRISAWVIGTRNAEKALLFANLEPTDRIREAEIQKDYGTRLALIEECKTLPFSAIWDYYCYKQDVPVGEDWLHTIKNHEKSTLFKRV